MGKRASVTTANIRISLIKRAKKKSCCTYFSTSFCGTLSCEVLATTLAYKCELFIPHSCFETSCINLVLGEFAQIVRRKRDGKIAQAYDNAKLYFELTFSWRLRRRSLKFLIFVKSRG